MENRTETKSSIRTIEQFVYSIIYRILFLHSIRTSHQSQTSSGALLPAHPAFSPLWLTGTLAEERQSTASRLTTLTPLTPELSRKLVSTCREKTVHAEKRLLNRMRGTESLLRRRTAFPMELHSSMQLGGSSSFTPQLHWRAFLRGWCSRPCSDRSPNLRLTPYDTESPCPLRLTRVTGSYLSQVQGFPRNLTPMPYAMPCRTVQCPAAELRPSRDIFVRTSPPAIIFPLPIELVLASPGGLTGPCIAALHAVTPGLHAPCMPSPLPSPTDAAAALWQDQAKSATGMWTFVGEYKAVMLPRNW